MKQEPKNEIDLLLRQVGRHTVDPHSANGNSGGMDEEHLDADELNAYAENSLPAAARVRYTIHLADCSRCRQLVSQLSLAAGTIAEEKPAIITASSGFKTLLSNLFSPVVLRYAVPALALVVVAFIGLTMFRQSADRQEFRSMTKSAQPNASESPAGPTNSVEQHEALNNTPKGYVDKVEKENKQANSSPNNAEPAKEGEVVAKKPVSEVKQAEAPPPPTDQVAAAAAPVAGANEPVAVSKSTVAADENKERKAEDAPRRGQSVAAATAPGTVTETVQVRQEEDEKKAKTQPVDSFGIAGNVSRSRAATQKAKNEKSGDKKLADADVIGGRDRADKDDSETRSVAGRRFRKEGEAWIDVAYDSSKRIINVTRGSDQYRALVADEPGIKTIADQLSGEVVVVWKSQTYRIR